MTEGKQGAAEWLRGIIDKCEVDRMRSCTAIAEAFGIDCKHEKSCRDCITRMMTDIAGRIDLEMMENERLKKENDDLKAELADWKGNAEGFQPDAYMKLPLDADGEPIRIGDEVNIDGDAMTVLGYRLYDDMLLLVAKGKKSGLFFTPKPSRVRHFKPEPADSWLRLSNDTRMGAVTYADKILGVDIMVTTIEEDYDAFARDIVRRAKALVKAGEGE